MALPTAPTGHLTAWADNLELQHVAISWQNIKNMLTAKRPWYSHLQNNGPNRTSVSLLDYIFMSVADVPSMTAYGITKAGLLFVSDPIVLFSVIGSKLYLPPTGHVERKE